MSLKLKIMIRAVKIRMHQGEMLAEIIGSYPNLTETEKKIIRENVTGS